MAGLLLGCSSTGNFQRESINTKGLFGEDTGAGSVNDTLTIADTPWQELFTDQLLKDLISEGINNNPDLQIAARQVQIAEAFLSQSKASFFPSISARGEGGWLRNPESTFPDGPRETEFLRLSAEAAWEIDIWGKLRRAKKAAFADLLASDAGKKAVQTRLVANIATAYYGLLALDTQLDIVRENVETGIDLVETLKILKASGQVTGAAVVQSEALRYEVEATIPDLEQQIRQTENLICLMLGRTPGHIRRGSLTSQKDTGLLKTGVPAQLLDNRPDVMQAEYSVIKAFELTKNARAYFYPALTITASSGFEAANLDKLFDPANFAASVIGGLAGPLLNRKENVTRLKVAKIQQEEALITMKNALLIAGQEVNDALGEYEASNKKTSLRKHQLEALEKSVSYTEELLKYGSATYTEVLNARQSFLNARLSDVDDRLQKLTAVASLYRALGGGWKE